MKLYVCYGTFTTAPRPGGHPCGNAYKALKEAGYEPEVIRAYGWGALPDFFNQTPGRIEVKRLTGNNWVPVLVTDDETVIQGSHKIADWARANPPDRVGGATSGGTTEAATAGGIAHWARENPPDGVGGVTAGATPSAAAVDGTTEGTAAGGHAEAG